MDSVDSTVDIMFDPAVGSDVNPIMFILMLIQECWLKNGDSDVVSNVDSDVDSIVGSSVLILL